MTTSSCVVYEIRDMTRPCNARQLPAAFWSLSHVKCCCSRAQCSVDLESSPSVSLHMLQKYPAPIFILMHLRRILFLSSAESRSRRGPLACPLTAFVHSSAISNALDTWAPSILVLASRRRFAPGGQGHSLRALFLSSRPSCHAPSATTKARSQTVPSTSVGVTSSCLAETVDSRPANNPLGRPSLPRLGQILQVQRNHHEAAPRPASPSLFDRVVEDIHLVSNRLLLSTSLSPPSRYLDGVQRCCSSHPPSALHSGV